MFDWNDLRYFIAFARTGSIGQTAKTLSLNQSTVQRRLRALEADFGCSLAERDAGGYRLTTNGEKLLAHAERVGEAADDLQRQLAALDHRPTGHVKLTSNVTVGQRLIKSGFLDEFHARHPGITIELIMEQRALDLSRGEADIAIRGGGPDCDALVGKRIADVPWALYATTTFIERNGRPTKPEDLDTYGVVELVGEIESLPAARWMKLYAPKAKVVASCSNIPSVHLAIRSGACIAPLPSVFAAEDKDLVCVLGPIKELNYSIFLFTHKDLRQLPRVRAVFDFCLRELKPVLMRGEMRR